MVDLFGTQSDLAAVRSAAEGFNAAVVHDREATFTQV
jgi:hypothetical protein